MLAAMLTSASVASSVYHLCDTDVYCVGGLTFLSLQVSQVSILFHLSILSIFSLAVLFLFNFIYLLYSIVFPYFINSPLPSSDFRHSVLRSVYDSCHHLPLPQPEKVSPLLHDHLRSFIHFTDFKQSNGSSKHGKCSCAVHYLLFLFLGPSLYGEESERRCNR